MFDTNDVFEEEGTRHNLPRRPELRRIAPKLFTADHTLAEPHLEGVMEVIEELGVGHSIIFTKPMRATDLHFLVKSLSDIPLYKYEIMFGSGTTEDPCVPVVLSKDKKHLLHRVLVMDQLEEPEMFEKYRYYYVDGISPKEIWRACSEDDEETTFSSVCFKRLNFWKKPYHLPGALHRYTYGMSMK